MKAITVHGSLPSKHFALCSLRALYLLYKIEDDNQQKDQLWCGIELTLWNKHDIEKQCVL